MHLARFLLVVDYFVLLVHVCVCGNATFYNDNNSKYLNMTGFSRQKFELLCNQIFKSLENRFIFFGTMRNAAFFFDIYETTRIFVEKLIY